MLSDIEVGLQARTVRVMGGLDATMPGESLKIIYGLGCLIRQGSGTPRTTKVAVAQAVSLLSMRASKRVTLFKGTSEIWRVRLTVPGVTVQVLIVVSQEVLDGTFIGTFRARIRV